MDTKRSQIEPVLLVESDGEAMLRLRQCFDGLPFELCEATTLEEAVQRVNERPPSLVMSEIVLPDGSGFSLCRVLRENPTFSTVPVVLLSHWSTEADRILAFHCGADDFVAKPFFAREVSSRIQAVLRRSRRSERPARTGVSPLADASEVRVEEHGVRVSGRFIDLTPREHALLIALVDRQGRVMSREELIAEAWRGEDPPNARNVDAHVKSLRRKLALSPDPIETVRGIGYRFSLKPGLERAETRRIAATGTG